MKDLRPVYACSNQEESIMKLIVSLLIAAPAIWGNLITNGGFESPKVTGATSAEYFAGSTDITGWLVIPGAPADVTVMRDDFTIGSLTFLPQSGTQSLNLTGDFSGEDAGVQQDVNLTIGDTYILTFFVGNADNSAPNFTLDATASLTINNSFIGLYTNGSNTHNGVNWKEFQYTFTATQTSNTIAFQNGTVPNEDYIGLDGVDLQDITDKQGGPTAPEPSTLFLGGAGFGLLWALARRRDRKGSVC
jgi:hypothetical protein